MTQAQRIESVIYRRMTEAQEQYRSWAALESPTDLELGEKEAAYQRMVAAQRRYYGHMEYRHEL